MTGCPRKRERLLPISVAQVAGATRSGRASQVIEPVAGMPHSAGTFRVDALTDREREVLTLVGTGLSNDEIAARLFLSPLTAKTHVSRIMTKLGARDRAQLVVAAYESGLVVPGSR